MILPTIGRQVWYQHGGAHLGDMTIRYPGPDANTQPMAATVVYVWADRMVSLDVIDHAGKHYAMTSVPLLQDDDTPPDHPYAQWMPYQVGQAKKAEAA